MNSVLFQCKMLLSATPAAISVQQHRPNPQGIEPMTLVLVLFLVIAFAVGCYLGFKLGTRYARTLVKREFEDMIPSIRKDAIEKSRSVLTGQFSEQLAPYLPDFPFNPNEARFIGKPVDFIVFRGLDERSVSEIVFVEVKSGKSKLNTNERSLKDAVVTGKVSWYEYRIPGELTRR